MVHPVLTAAHELGPFLSEHAARNESERRLCAPVVEALRPTGLFRMAVPAVYGGPEVDVPSMLQAIEEVSKADGATGWCVNISTTTSTLSGFLSAEWARELFKNPLDAYGGAFAPTGKGQTVDGGWLVDGRWMWGSGTEHCAWINGGVITDAGEMRLMFFERAQVEHLDTWHASGLRGTGSTDYQVTQAFVPRGREIWVGKVWAQVDSPVSRFPNFNLLACGLAAVCLGIAARAVEEIVALLREKPGAAPRTKAAEYPPAQLNIAHAEAILAGARALLYSEAAAAWDAVVRGERPPVEQKARVRLAAAHVAMECARVVDLCYNSGGGSSVFQSSPLQRCFRDIHTATQHMMLSDRNHMTFGRLRFGLEADTALL
jgi:alkylation response protein AidB-like acyl-CoA dehydrogenase